MAHSKKDIEDWLTQTVPLNEDEIKQYSEIFIKHNYNSFSSLQNITQQILNDIGIVNINHQIMIISELTTTAGNDQKEGMYMLSVCLFVMVYSMSPQNSKSNMDTLLVPNMIIGALMNPQIVYKNANIIQSKWKLHVTVSIPFLSMHLMKHIRNQMN